MPRDQRRDEIGLLRLIDEVVQRGRRGRFAAGGADGLLHDQEPALQDAAARHSVELGQQRRPRPRRHFQPLVAVAPHCGIQSRGAQQRGLAGISLQPDARGRAFGDRDPDERFAGGMRDEVAGDLPKPAAESRRRSSGRSSLRHSQITCCSQALADSTSVANTTVLLAGLRWCDGSSEKTADGNGPYDHRVAAA